MEPVAGPLVSANPSAMARYSSPVSSTSRSTSPKAEARGSHQGAGDADDHAPAPDRAAEKLHEFHVGRPLGTHCVGHRVRPIGPRLDGHLGEVIDVDGADPVLAAAPDREHRQVAQKPGDVVEEHPIAAEEDRGPQHRVGHAHLGQGAFDLGLAPEVAVRRRRARMGDRHVDDPLHPHLARRMEQQARIGDGTVEVGPVVGKADPVRVVERGGALERRRQPQHVVEIERAHVHGASRTGALGVARQRAHPAPGAFERAGDRGAGVAEGPRHDVEPLGRELGVPRLRRVALQAESVCHRSSFCSCAAPNVSNTAASWRARSKRARAGERSPSRCANSSSPR